MIANPRFALLLARYAQMDQITLVLAGLAVVAVLLGMTLSDKTPTWQRSLYYVFFLIVFILALAGAAYMVITGGQS